MLTKVLPITLLLPVEVLLITQAALDKASIHSSAVAVNNIYKPAEPSILLVFVFKSDVFFRNNRDIVSVV